MEGDWGFTQAHTHTHTCLRYPEDSAATRVTCLHHAFSCLPGVCTVCQAIGAHSCCTPGVSPTGACAVGGLLPNLEVLAAVSLLGLLRVICLVVVSTESPLPALVTGKLRQE